MKKKFIKYGGIVGVVLCIYIIWQFAFPNPFGYIKEVVWEWKYRNTDMTTIMPAGNDVIYSLEESILEIEEVEKYINTENMALSWAEQDKDYLVILLENYSRSRHNEEEGVYRFGPMGFFNGARVLLVDREKEEIIEEVEITDGKVIYMDRNQYGIMKHEIISFYSLSTGEMIKEEILNGFEQDEWYVVEQSRYTGEVRIYLQNGHKLLGRINIPDGSR